MSGEISHGRGGAGNINSDDTEYVDGEVVRAGPEGSHGDGAYSAGRGGAGNIADVGVEARHRNDVDVVPDAALRPSQDGQDFHTGRGGAGNEHAAAGDGKPRADRASAGSLADRLKGKLLAAFRK